MPNTVQKPLSKIFDEFFQSEKASGFLLILCTAASLGVANSPLGEAYRHFWHVPLVGLSIQHWINDGLMAVFFLLIGLELERELYDGELSDLRNALLPIAAAAGGVAVPAAIHFTLNHGTYTQSGLGIPMATDIAFALAVLAIVGSRVPASLRLFVAALAVIDDLIAIIVIAVFYSSDLAPLYLIAALGVLTVMAVMNRRFRIMALSPYLMLGILMWYFTLKSGVHATISGVLLAFVLPYSASNKNQVSPSARLEHILHKPVAFAVLPLFALANTAIPLSSTWTSDLLTANSLGIMLGLLVGKPVGIFCVSFLAVAIGLCRLPTDLSWRHIGGAGLLGGIGFTMSIFIANLAFPDEPLLIDSSKTAILCVSLVAGVLGLLWLRMSGRSRK
ncbi:MAG: Na+/H+ antiporter NhaA [Povalibacter sp.]